MLFDVLCLEVAVGRLRLAGSLFAVCCVLLVVRCLFTCPLVIACCLGLSSVIRCWLFVVCCVSFVVR